ncbi:hypothetical protein ATANTOWER_021213 [Ataeniobius toweri]|uniref:Uncharacterized protein n=1 Tax=Ataeniobius toweri TaxID=208326 RepID=A0ABU7BHH6_9TELE|nr:hypothetical protein [Ataeniobius toweri]
MCPFMRLNGQEDTTHVNLPCSKKQKVADVGTTPESTEKAKDGTVWFHRKVGDFSAHETPQTAFNGSGGYQHVTILTLKRKRFEPQSKLKNLIAAFPLFLL